jgi:LL-diaminopimelate aminotransferase
MMMTMVLIMMMMISRPFLSLGLVVVSLLILVTKSTVAFQPSSSSSPPASTTTALSMVARNVNFAKLAGGYLFPEIGRRRNLYARDHPELADRIISLGIGDTTLPIPPHILAGLQRGATKLGTVQGYTGYGDVQGRMDLRTKIATTLYKGIIEPEEVFVTGTLDICHVYIVYISCML